MKRFILALSLFISVISYAEEFQETYSYGFDEYIEKCTDIPVARTINGGTIFNITYGEGWTLEMKGAFEYACKIWEENMPTSLPINIKAEIGTIRGSLSQNTISKIKNRAYENLSEQNDWVIPYKTQIKAVILREAEKGQCLHFVDSISDLSFFNETDFTITYNKSLLDQFSFSLYSTPTDKYDFVTLVLRDIARGLGIYSMIRGSETSQTLSISGNYPYEFESLIWSALGTSDAQEAYTNATQGQLDIDVSNFGTLHLYAPANWQNEISLNTFIPDSTHRITELLSYEFGRGSVIRNIADAKYQYLFANALGWKADNTVGSNTSTSNTIDNTDNVIPYGGSVSFGSTTSPAMVLSLEESTQAYSISPLSEVSSIIYEYCMPYHPYYISDGKSYMTSDGVHLY